jgi:hypothetical protein
VSVYWWGIAVMARWCEIWLEATMPFGKQETFLSLFWLLRLQNLSFFQNVLKLSPDTGSLTSNGR